MPQDKWKDHAVIVVLLFDDETHTVQKGCLKSKPLCCFIGNIPLKHHITASSWFLLGFHLQFSLSKEEIKGEFDMH